MLNGLMFLYWYESAYLTKKFDCNNPNGYNLVEVIKILLIFKMIEIAIKCQKSQQS